MWMGLSGLLPFFVFCIISPYYSFYNKKFQHSTYYSLFLSILYMTWSNATATAELSEAAERGRTKWTKCQVWKHGPQLEVSESWTVDNVVDVVERSERLSSTPARPTFMNSFQRRVNGHGRAISSKTSDHEFQRRVNVFIIFGQGRAISSKTTTSFKEEWMYSSFLATAECRIHHFREDWLVTLENVSLVLRAENGYVALKLKKIGYVSFSGEVKSCIWIYIEYWI